MNRAELIEALAEKSGLSKQKAKKVFKELPPKASKKRKSAVKNKDVSKKPTRKRKK